MASTVELTGDKRLIEKLKQLPRKAERKVVRESIRAGTKELAQKTKSAAPVLSGLMKRLINVRALKAKRGRVGSRIGFRNSEALTRTSKEGKRYFYPAAVEYGHDGADGTHFMKSTFERNEAGVTSLIMQRMKDGIERDAEAK